MWPDLTFLTLYTNSQAILHRQGMQSYTYSHNRVDYDMFTVLSKIEYITVQIAM